MSDISSIGTQSLPLHSSLERKSEAEGARKLAPRKTLLSIKNREKYTLEKVRLVAELVSFITAYVRKNPANPEHIIATDDKIWLEDVLWTSANGKGITIDGDGIIDGKVTWLFGLPLQKQEGDVIQYLHDILFP